MLLSLNWLREFVPFMGTAQELGDKLTMLGLELEGISRPFEEISGITIGEVLECGKHPDADKLSVCKVDVGTEILDIVCGAPNVAKGQKVPVATVGVVMPVAAGGFAIKKTKLRGQDSCGMICSERELGLSDAHAGIYVLDPAAPVGTKLVDYLDLNDEVLDISITPNRADCLSVLGLAREVALVYNLPLNMPSTPQIIECEGDAALNIEIKDHNLCPSYLGRVIKGFKVGPSSNKIKHRLQAIGIRPISNIVDITNYILMELGQPLHAFDLDKLSGNKIIVDTAQNGETFVSLDGQERKLLNTDLTIRDAEKAVALAGVMGGQNTEIDENSTNLLLECAIFNPSSVRKTARRLALHSDSSYRYERGVDQVNSRFAMNRAAALMCQAAGGQLLKAEQGYEGKAWQALNFEFRPQRACALLGVELEKDFCYKTLVQLGCKIDQSNPELWQITPPAWRQDFSREVDLIEEVGRVYGVDLIPPTLPNVPRCLEKAGARKSEFSFWMQLREWAAGSGLNEAINYSFVGHKDLDNLNLPSQGRISIKNPLNAELDVLRLALSPGLLNSLRVNLSQANTGVRLFELAHIFESDPSSQTTAKESGRMGIMLYGDRHSAWPHKDAEHDYLDLKGYLENLLAFLKLDSADFVLLAEHAFLSPGIEVKINNQVVAFMGQVKTEIADIYHARKPVWLAEIDIDALALLSEQAHTSFKSLPVYPAVKRDITFICQSSLKIEELKQAIVALKRPLLENVELVDVFKPEEKNERNLTLRLTFRHLERTLKDSEIDKERENIVALVQKSLNVSV